MIGPLGIGDVCAVQTTGVPAYLIRLGAALRGQATPANHVVIVHHKDARGRWWGIEGRPGGVAWCQMAEYVNGPLARLANSNYAQPRTDAQRAEAAATAEGLLTVGYDWVGGIIPDGLEDVHARALAGLIDKCWGWGDDGKAHGEVVCSSAAAWDYDHNGLAAPKGDAETVQPADWWTFNAEQGWLTR